MPLKHHASRDRQSRDEDGGFTLIELSIAVALSTLVVLAGAMLLINATESTNSLAVMANLDSKVSVVLSQATNELDNAQPLGYCLQDLPAGDQLSYETVTFSTPWSQCYRSGSFGPALYSATDNGMCFYTYPGNTSSPSQIAAATLSTAPDLECIWVTASPGGTSTSTTAAQQYQLWVSTWQPSGGSNATYTTCDPDDCWAGAPSPGYTPTSTTSCGTPSTSCPSQILIGTLEAPPSNSSAAPWFSYYSYDNGTTINNYAGAEAHTGSCPPPSTQLDGCLSQIVQVQFDVVVLYNPAGPQQDQPHWSGQTTNYTYLYTANLWGALDQNQQCWDASGAALSCPPAATTTSVSDQ